MAQVKFHIRQLDICSVRQFHTVAGHGIWIYPEILSESPVYFAIHPDAFADKQAFKLYGINSAGFSTMECGRRLPVY
ncbi:MAG: hypothetical protein LBG96_14045 [Tannerella sp.]|nr:hypothetical protein [Tannerella sp.]